MSVTRHMWLVVLFLVFTMTIGLEGAAAQTTTIKLLGYEISLTDVYYNAAADETTFTYLVKATRDARRGLSHFILAFCFDESVIVRSSHRPIEVGKDPTTGLTGIKFDDFEMEPEEEPQRVVWFVLKGDWPVEEIEIAAKAATLTATGVIAGPACDPGVCLACDPPACVVESIVDATRIDFRALRPGTYATKLGNIFLYGNGNGGAKVTFTDFGHAQYLADRSGPPIEVAYSLGPTLAHAEAFGWRPADEFNGTELSFSKGEVQGGVELTLWIRYVVRSSNFSSDYEAMGTINVIPVCE